MKRKLCGPLACALMGLAVPALAQTAAREYNLEIDRQPLKAALKQFSRQTGLQVGYLPRSSAEENMMVSPLKGEYTAETALYELLGSTGLSFKRVNDNTIAVVAMESSAAPTQFMRTAAAPAPAAGQEEASEAWPSVALIEEMVITGSQIRGIENNTAPLIVLSKDYIDSTGFGNTSKLIESLPQNFALANQTGVNITDVSSTREQGSSINLRGIGEGTTLVLLNGRRLAAGYKSAAVDISALPLTALEQVEILTDGASALYGSDAVGGVVNFILRDDFEGAQTRLRSGWADGTNEYRGSQALGASWDSGNALLSLEYYKRDLLLAKDRDFIPTASLIGSLLPEDENYSAVFTGEQQLFGPVTLFADVLYSQRDSFNQGGRVTFRESGTVDNPQGHAALGVEWAVGGDWQIEISGSYGKNDLNVLRGNTNAAGVNTSTTFDSMFESEGAQIKADGTVFTLPGGNVRMALGGEWRSDSYEEVTRNLAGVATSSIAADQDVTSAFAEAYIPLVGQDNAMTGMQNLELSLAARYDDYSSFGSSVDPQYGLMWEPVNGLRLRARHGTSYKAPNLIDYSFGANIAAAVATNDPGAPGGTSYQLQVSGIDVDGLDAQESESSSFGIEIRPPSLEGLSVSVNYYRIKYENRIATPPLPTVTLANPAAFGNLIIRGPSVDQVNQFIALARLGRGFTAFSTTPNSPALNPNFTPDQVQVIVDSRRRNLSVADTSGVDFSSQFDFDAAGGRFGLGLGATYVLELERQITDTSVPFETVNTFLNPPELRARGYVGYQRAGWSTNLFVNHTDSYVDNRRPATLLKIDAYTTVDARLAYSFSERFSTGFLSGLTIAANVQNALDEDPPQTAVVSTIGDLGFDPTNASPLGRFISVEISKTW